MNGKEIDANPLGERVESKIIAGYFPELKANPFGLRICQVFSSDETGETMNFEDFLDMISVFSENAPLQMKADWAFRIFDFDEDGKITASDIERVVRQLCGNEQFSRQELDKIIFHVIIRIFDFLDFLIFSLFQVSDVSIFPQVSEIKIVRIFN